MDSLEKRLMLEHRGHQTVYDDDRRRKALFKEAADQIKRLRKLGTEVAMDAFRQKQSEGIHPTTGHPIIELLSECGATRAEKNV